MQCVCNNHKNRESGNNSQVDAAGSTDGSNRHSCKEGKGRNRIEVYKRNEVDSGREKTCTHKEARWP